MDKLLEEVFKTERWEKALQKGIIKDISKKDLRLLTKPDVRLKLYLSIKEGSYRIIPPHQALIPKDTPGEFRTVYICENIDRILLSIINDVLFEFCKNMVHKQCKSYQIGLSCGKTVKEAVGYMNDITTAFTGLKADLTKYFDSVDRVQIMKVFDKVESQHGKSKIIDLLRDLYNTDLVFDLDNNLIEHYKSLGQGIATASFLADSILFDMDKKFSEELAYYVRYSDDILMVTPTPDVYQKKLEEELSNYGLTLNPKKVEFLTKEKFFKFLGYAIRGSEISLTNKWIKHFQKEIESATIKNKDITYTKAVNMVNAFLYKGCAEGFSWATAVLPVVNVDKDIDVLNNYVMDALRAVQTGHRKIGGLGYETDKKVGCISRGTGRNVKANREKTEKELPGYKSLRTMKNALLYSRELYNAIVSQM